MGLPARMGVMSPPTGKLAVAGVVSRFITTWKPRSVRVALSDSERARTA